MGRAVASVLDGNAAHASVAVVCHNIAAEEIAQALRPEHRARVWLLEHRDEHRSASGPFNAGIASSEAEFVAIMGSDDTLAPHAIDSWLALAERTGRAREFAREADVLRLLDVSFAGGGAIRANKIMGVIGAVTFLVIVLSRRNRVAL